MDTASGSCRMTVQRDTPDTLQLLSGMPRDTLTFPDPTEAPQASPGLQGPRGRGGRGLNPRQCRLDVSSVTLLQVPLDETCFPPCENQRHLCSRVVRLSQWVQESRAGSAETGADSGGSAQEWKAAAPI